MPRKSPYVIVLSDSERTKLERTASKYTSPYFLVVRARVILMAAQGLDNKTIGERLSLPRQIVSKWRKRFFEERLDGLEDRPRTGRPSAFPPNVVIQVKALACELPFEQGVPLSRFTTRDIALEAIDRGIVAQISGSTVWQWLTEDAIKPWRHRSWIFPRDAQFEEKAGRVLDLYHAVWQGVALNSDEFVICADEKTSIQARRRRHETLPPGQGKCMKVEHEYERMGALNYLAAWDVRHAKVFGRCEAQSGIQAFDRLVSDVMGRQPYRSAKRVSCVVDNGSSHRGQLSINRLQNRWPNLILVHLPVHASWLNEIEIYFSIVQRKVLTPNDFPSLEILAQTILAFQDRYERIAKPFQWKFTRDDLAKMMTALSQQSTPLDRAA